MKYSKERRNERGTRKIMKSWVKEKEKNEISEDC